MREMTTGEIIVRGDIFGEIVAERDRQDTKFGDQSRNSLDRWNTILGEEVGEVAKAILEEDNENLEEELVQVAAVCVAILEYRRRRKIGLIPMFGRHDVANGNTPC